MQRLSSAISQPAFVKLYAEVIQTQSWRPNVGIAELGEDNLFHLGPDGLEAITMVLVEYRQGRPLDDRYTVVAKPDDMGLMINPVLDPAGVQLISKTTESYLF